MQQRTEIIIDYIIISCFCLWLYICVMFLVRSVRLYANGAAYFLSRSSLVCSLSSLLFLSLCCCCCFYYSDIIHCVLLFVVVFLHFLIFI